MTDRVLDFSELPAHLSIRNRLLVIKRDGVELDAIPCEDIAAVIASNRDVLFTQAVLADLAAAGAIFIACDERSMPASMLLPLDAHHAQSARFRLQTEISEPRRKRLWQSIVRAKIRAQGTVLKETTGDAGGLPALIDRVGSGDVANVEARAARRYWSCLFAPHPFQRSDLDDPRNHVLNYGYAVLRAVTARAICASGLHPSLSLFHTNAQNPFGLADDLMEPFRPVVDRVVVQLARERDLRLDPPVKRRLIAAVLARLEIGGERRTLVDALFRLAQSLVRAYAEAGSTLWLPAWRPAEDEAE
jgi:CRISPR-associated protein Cas1